MMKRTLYLLLMLLWLASCSESDEPCVSQDKLITVSFETPVQTRAATGTTALVENALIKVYAYNQGTTITVSDTPLAEGTYKVAAGTGGLSSFEAVAGQVLKLYAGNYDLYFVSYNSATTGDVPSVGSYSSLISALTNGKDFLYASMKNIGIRSDSPGSTQCLITLNQPFLRLCSSLQLKVKAKENGHPIVPTSIKLTAAKIENLSDSRYFLLGKEALNAPSGYTGNYTFSTFSGNDSGTGSTGAVTTATPTTEITHVLPTDGTKSLKITITLSVSFVDAKGTSHTDEAYTYEIITNKALMPGTFYQFVFTLTFYGNYLPDNLELDILPYVDAPLNTGQVGG